MAQGPKRGKLGSNLEWHGAIIRVVVRVPPSLRKVLGKGKLKEPLRTSVPREAEILKLPVLYKLRQQIRDATAGKPSGDPLIEKAFDWRQSLRMARAAEECGSDFPVSVDKTEWALDEVKEQVAREVGPARAALFGAVATGTATPLTHLVNSWLAEASYGSRRTARKTPNGRRR